MVDDFEQRLDEVEAAIKDLWRCVDQVWLLHGRMPPAWTIERRTDAIARFRQRLKRPA